MSQITAKKCYNTHKKEISFTIRDKIFINVKNLRVRKSCKKLTDRYIEFFKMSKFVNPNAYELCQSSRRYSAEGPGQLLVRIRDLGCNRGRDGYAPVPRRGRAISIILFKGPAVSVLAL
jgi:hypothetical protein